MDEFTFELNCINLHYPGEIRDHENFFLVNTSSEYVYRGHLLFMSLLVSYD